MTAVVTIDEVAAAMGRKPEQVEAEAQLLGLTIRPDWANRPALAVDEARALASGQARESPRPPERLGATSAPNARTGGPPVTNPPVMRPGRSGTKLVVGCQPARLPPKPGGLPPRLPRILRKLCRDPDLTAPPPNRWSSSPPRRRA